MSILNLNLYKTNKNRPLQPASLYPRFRCIPIFPEQSNFSLDIFRIHVLKSIQTVKYIDGIMLLSERFRESAGGASRYRTQCAVSFPSRFCEHRKVSKETRQAPLQAMDLSESESDRSNAISRVVPRIYQFVPEANEASGLFYSQ